MLKIAHRINTIEQLKKVPKNQGIELDLRYEDKNIILQHEPFETGELFTDFLKFYRHQLIILNVKSEGIESKILEILNQHQIKNYFFLDLSLPFLVKYAREGEKNIAIRFSEFEPLEFVLSFAGLLDWIWVDCFTKMPLNESNYAILKKHFKICLVSPELQNHPKENILTYKKQLKNFQIDAVCTKFPELWN